MEYFYGSFATCTYSRLSGFVHARTRLIFKKIDLADLHIADGSNLDVLPWVY